MPEPAFRADIRPAEAPAAVLSSSSAGWFGAAWTAAEAGTRHSRRVALLKRVLPVIGVVLLLLIAIWPRLAPLWDRMRFAFPAIDLREAKELQMVNPRYAGVDRTGRPFVVTAASGRQVPDRQDLMSLRSPQADLKTHAGADVVVTSATGVYQSQTQLLDLFGEVTLVHQNGTRFVTNSARVNAATIDVDGRVQGDMVAKKSIKVSQSAIVRGNIRAPSVSITEGANFNGGVTMESNAGSAGPSTPGASSR